jgi:serine/threonine protein kinase
LSLHAGFSVVKTGTNILTGEPVAIKIIDRSKYGPKDESLEREIQVLEKVFTSRILMIYDSNILFPTIITLIL